MEGTAWGLNAPFASQLPLQAPRPSKRSRGSLSAPFFLIDYLVKHFSLLDHTQLITGSLLDGIHTPLEILDLSLKSVVSLAKGCQLLFMPLNLLIGARAFSLASSHVGHPIGVPISPSSEALQGSA